MGKSGNPANRSERRALAKSSGVRGQLFSRLVVIDDLGDKPSDAIAVAIVTGLGDLVAQGADPLSRCAITLGTDHPEHPGKIVLELKTDRVAPAVAEVALNLADRLGEPLTLDGGK
jgi:hypothetical protein